MLNILRGMTKRRGIEKVVFLLLLSIAFSLPLHAKKTKPKTLKNPKKNVKIKTDPSKTPAPDKTIPVNTKPGSPTGKNPPSTPTTDTPPSLQNIKPPSNPTGLPSKPSTTSTKKTGRVPRPLGRG